jgi:probable F420-dependent oxidoreductase
MQIGATYPQTEMEPDPGAVHHFTQAVEEMGFGFVLGFDHVLGANRASRPGRTLPYDLDSPFHEPLMLFAFMASVTKKLQFATGVLVLTQRQTALVAKQVACLDLLSEGRFRLGIGTGWNETEYEALGMDFKTRGARIEEQVTLMRELWTKRAVTFEGKDHKVTDAGLVPLPTKSIPIWFGGGVDRSRFGGEPANLNVVRRIAKLGDGWIQQNMPFDRAQELIDIMHGYAREYGRNPKDIGLETSLAATRESQDGWAEEVQGWRKLGMTHLAVNTMRDGLLGVDAHLKRLALFREAVGPLEAMA